MNPARFLLPLAILGLSVGIPRPLGAAQLRTKLQIINASSQPIEIFWLKSDTERVPNGVVAPGEDTVITTALGHRFAVVSRGDKSTATQIKQTVQEILDHYFPGESRASNEQQGILKRNTNRMTNQTQANGRWRSNADFATPLLPWLVGCGPALVGGMGDIGKRRSEFQAEGNN